MKCPFCSEEMKEGFVRSGATRAGLINRGSGSGFLYWNDDEKKAGLRTNE